MSGANISILSGPDHLPLEDGTALHLLSALEVLEARAEARRLPEALAGEEALCANACILARALRREGEPLFEDGKAVLARLGVSQIQALARRWAAFDREANPDFSVGEERLAVLKKACTCRRSACAGMCSAAFRRFLPSRASAR